MNIDKIFKEYKSFVENVINSYINDMDEAKDLTNVVFIKVYQNLDKFDQSNLGGWIRTIAVNTAIDYLRHRKTNKEVSIPETDDEGLSLDIFGDGTENDVVDHITYNQLIENFKNLPPKKRKIFTLFYVDNMTVEDISKVLNKPKGTIKATLSRTRKKMKKNVNSNSISSRSLSDSGNKPLQ